MTEALNSAEAAQIRFNNTLRDVSTTGRELTRGFVSEFASEIQNGASKWEAFGKSGTNALTKISDKLFNMALDNLWGKAFGGSGGTNILGNLFSALGGSSYNPAIGDGIGGLGPTAPSGLPGYANGTNDAPGGWSVVGENGPEKMYVPKHATIIPNGYEPPNATGSGGPVIANFNVQTNTTESVKVKEPKVSKNSDGSLNIDVLINSIEGKLASRIRRGNSPLNDAHEQRYALNPARGNSAR